MMFGNEAGFKPRGNEPGTQIIIHDRPKENP